MTAQPTYDDANLILRLYELRREPRLRDARKWFGAAPQFRSREEWLKLCPAGSEENTSYRMVVTYWDMAASFVVNGILHPELFYRSNNGELMFVWEKIKLLTPELRETQKNPLLYRNIEEVAKGYAGYMRIHAPEWLEGFFAPMIAKIGR